MGPGGPSATRRGPTGARRGRHRGGIPWPAARCRAGGARTSRTSGSHRITSRRPVLASCGTAGPDHDTLFVDDHPSNRHRGRSGHSGHRALLEPEARKLGLEHGFVVRKRANAEKPCDEARKVGREARYFTGYRDDSHFPCLGPRPVSRKVGPERGISQVTVTTPTFRAATPTEGQAHCTCAHVLDHVARKVGPEARFLKSFRATAVSH